MSVEVVTVWTPRTASVQWRDDYVSLLRMQKRTVLHWGHRYTIVTDQPKSLPPKLFIDNKLIVDLDSELMPAMIQGVLERLERPVSSHLVFVDADVLVTRDLEEAFDGTFDVALTRRADQQCPINNGAMYVDRSGVAQAFEFFLRAYRMCGTHWGADQEAISAAAAPVPDTECVEQRDGMRLAFVSMLTHNRIPKERGKRAKNDPFVIHFKGSITKQWADEYAMRFILNVGE